MSEPNTPPPQGFDADVMIAGGGMVGASLALALDQAGVSVAVADAAVPATTLAPHFDGRAFAIAFASYRMFRALGLGPDLDPYAQRIEQIMVTDGRPLNAVRRGGASLFKLHFDSAEIDGEGGEALGYMLENRYIRLALDKAVRARGSIRSLAPNAVTAITPDPHGVRVGLQDGQSVRARLLVGADGRGSFVRKTMGIRTVGRAYPVTALVATVSHERPHGGVAHEFFLPAGPFAILPLVGNRANIVWAEPHAAAQALLAMSQADFLAELGARFGDFLGTVRLEGPRFTYPLALQLAESFIAPRVALCGDAAHGIHPIAGQGLNLGLQDVAALAEVIVDAIGLGLDPGEVTMLRRYQTWRRPPVMAMAAATDFFDRLFSNDLAPVRLARGLGMAAVDAIGPARRFFMTYAGGAAGSLPKLLRGEGLAA